MPKLSQDMMKETRLAISPLRFRFLIEYKETVVHRLALIFQYPEMDADDMEYSEPSPQYLKTARRYYCAAMKERFPIRWRLRVMKNAYAERLRLSLLPVALPLKLAAYLISRKF